MESKVVWLLQRRSKALSHVYNNMKHTSTRVLSEQPSPSSPSSLLNPSRFFSSVSGRSTASSTCVAARNSVIYGFRALHRHHKVHFSDSDSYSIQFDLYIEVVLDCEKGWNKKGSPFSPNLTKMVRKEKEPI